MYGFGGTIDWDDLEPHPLHALLNHSDCDGEINWVLCKGIADALSEVLPKLQEDDDKERTQTFIDGLLLAYKKKQNLEFH